MILYTKYDTYDRASAQSATQRAFNALLNECPLRSRAVLGCQTIFSVPSGLAAAAAAGAAAGEGGGDAEGEDFNRARTTPANEPEAAATPLVASPLKLSPLPNARRIGNELPVLSSPAPKTL